MLERWNVILVVLSLLFLQLWHKNSSSNIDYRSPSNLPFPQTSWMDLEAAGRGDVRTLQALTTTSSCPTTTPLGCPSRGRKGWAAAQRWELSALRTLREYPIFFAWNLWHADDSPWSWINTVDCSCQGSMGWPRRAEGRRSKARYRLRGGSDGLGQNNRRERPAGTTCSQPYQVFLRRPHELFSFTERYVFTSVTVGCVVSCGGSISTLPLL